eukprot:843368-Pleurochrysis_carterae.AAC.1
MREYINRVGVGGGTGATSLSALADVEITQLSETQLLSFTQGSQRWVTRFSVVNDAFLPSDSHLYIPTVQHVQWQLSQIELLPGPQGEQGLQGPPGVK